MKKFSAIFFILVISACSFPGLNPARNADPMISLQETNTPARPTSVASPTAIPVPKHRIGVRQVDGVGEFYDRESGEKFIPRGTNYLRLGNKTEMDGRTTFEQITFDTNYYDPQAAESALEQMQYLGYNTIRVFLTDSTEGVLGDSTRIRPAYLDNLADFLTRASTHEIFVIFTIDWLPGGIYGEQMNRSCCEVFTSTNVQMLTEDGVSAHALFFQDLFKGLYERAAPVEYILAYQIRNEAYFDTTSPPFTLGTSVTAANGQSYDMNSQGDWVRMVEEGLVYYIDTVRTAVRTVDPTALVTVGFFVPQTPNPVRQGDSRLIETEKAIWESSADFIDLHAYPGFSFSLQKTVENYKMDGMREKPIIMGEFGAFKSQFGTPASGANALKAWQIESCQYGFDGWLLWHWDTREDPNLWNAVNSDEAIARTLSPVEMPDPCSE